MKIWNLCAEQITKKNYAKIRGTQLWIRSFILNQNGRQVNERKRNTEINKNQQTTPRIKSFKMTDRPIDFYPHVFNITSHHTETEQAGRKNRRRQLNSRANEWAFGVYLVRFVNVNLVLHFYRLAPTTRKSSNCVISKFISIYIIG